MYIAAAFRLRSVGLPEFFLTVSRIMDKTPVDHCHSVTPCHAGAALVHAGLTNNKCSSHKQQHVDELIAPASHPLYASSPQQQLELLGDPRDGAEPALLTPTGPTTSPPHPTLYNTIHPDWRDPSLEQLDLQHINTCCQSCLKHTNTCCLVWSDSKHLNTCCHLCADCQTRTSCWELLKSVHA